MLKILHQLDVVPAIEELELARTRLRRRSRRNGEARAVRDIFDLTIAPGTLLVAAAVVLRSDGARSEGGDGMSVRDLVDPAQIQLVLDDLHDQLANGTYEPKLARSVPIPKGDGSTRWLTIPAITDRIVQTAALLVLEVILEPMFSDRSYGYRRGRNAHQAVEQAVQVMKGHPIDHVVRLDIQKFFDEVNHPILLRLLADHVGDGRFIDLVERMLSTQTRRPDGTLFWSGRGVPQGGVISPILANLYLDGLDKLFDPPGGKFGIRGGMSPGKHGTSVRYADDVLVLAHGDRAHLQDIYELVGSFLAGARDLRLAGKKSAVVDVAEGFPFLGFEVRKKTNAVEVRPDQSRVEKFIDRMTIAIEELPAHLEEELRRRRLLQKWMGWAMYMGQATHLERIQVAAQEIDSRYSHQGRTPSSR